MKFHHTANTTDILSDIMLIAQARAATRRLAPLWASKSRALSAPTAVLFDLGGVILGSPMAGIAAYERAAGIPDRFVNGVISSSGSDGSFARLERGELVLSDWYSEFEAECLAAGATVDARALMASLSSALTPRSHMLDTVRGLKTKGFKVAAVTNNWKGETDRDYCDAMSTAMTAQLFGAFDEVVESCEVGAAKPMPEIFLEACRRLDTAPEDCVFLDDIGKNCKAASQLGMAAIKVADSEVPAPSYITFRAQTKRERNAYSHMMARGSITRMRTQLTSVCLPGR